MYIVNYVHTHMYAPSLNESFSMVTTGKLSRMFLRETIGITKAR